MIRLYLITLIVYLSGFALAFSQSNEGDIIDIESLGLDNVNKKEVLAIPVIKINNKKDLEEKKKVLSLPNIAIKEEKKIVKTKPSIKKKLEIKKKPSEGKDKVKEKKISKSIINIPYIKTKNGTIIKAIKPPEPKVESKKAVEILDNNKKLNEIIEQQRKVELEKLREKYILKRNPVQSSETIILPKRKMVNPFVSEEIPAPPILDSYRTRDNNHIPVFLSLNKRIKNLFETITYGDVAFFNSAYHDVKNPNIKNELGDSLLTYALLTQEHAIVASLISKGADVNIPNSLGYTPLDIVIELKDLQNFELLINNKANINYTDKFGRTYLFHAARLGFLPAVKILIRKNININALDKDGFSALDIAYKNKKELVVQYLLKNGAKTWIEKPFDPRNTSLIKKLESRWGENLRNNSQY